MTKSKISDFIGAESLIEFLKKNGFVCCENDSTADFFTMKIGQDVVLVPSNLSKNKDHEMMEAIKKAAKIIGLHESNVIFGTRDMTLFCAKQIAKVAGVKDRNFTEHEVDLILATIKTVVDAMINVGYKL